ncbi:MAG: amidohydrolase [Lachnospiraceae bacterium]|nr:amidohydrolase [Lachnospiraceae bacterium]
MSLLLSNALILQGKDFEPVRGFLGIRGTEIDYIGEERPAAAYDAEKDMDGAILIPGLVNAHGHAAMTLLRGIGSGLPLGRWLEEAVFPVEDKLNPDIVRAGNALALLEMIACGTTSFTDMYNDPEVLVEQCLDCGIKVNIGRPFLCFDPNEKLEDSFRAQAAFALFEKYNMAGEGRIRIEFPIHAEYTNKSEPVRAFSAEVKKRGGRIHLHLSETRAEVDACKAKYGQTPPLFFASRGTFSNPTYAAHCVHLSDSDLQLLRQYHVVPVHCPSSNMKLASGIAPVAKMIREGLAPALGTDGCASNNNLNMFEEMHLAALLSKVGTGDATVLSAREVLAMATANGAAAQGRMDTGILEEGLKADIAAVSVRRPHMYPDFDPADLIVYSAQASDVCLTVADGRVLYEDGQYLTLDRDRILAEAEKAVKALYA